MSVLTFLVFFDFLFSILAFLHFGCCTLAFFDFSSVPKSFCLLFLFCSVFFSTRDCLYGELVTISDSFDRFDFFFSVREGNFMIIEKLTCCEDGSPWSTTGGSLGAGGEFLDSEGTGSIGAVSSVTDNDSVD